MRPDRKWAAAPALVLIALTLGGVGITMGGGLGSLAGAAAACGASPLEVTNGADANPNPPPGSLRYAVDHAKRGAMITFCSPTVVHLIAPLNLVSGLEGVTISGGQIAGPSATEEALIDISASGVTLSATHLSGVRILITNASKVKLLGVSFENFAATTFANSGTINQQAPADFAIDAEQADELTLDHVTINALQQNGLWYRDSDHLTVSNSGFSLNHHVAIEEEAFRHNSHGLLIREDTSDGKFSVAPHDGLIAHNTLTGDGGVGIGIGEPKPGYEQLRIEDNTLTKDELVGARTKLTVKNNHLSGGDGINFACGRDPDSGPIRFEHNDLTEVSTGLRYSCAEKHPSATSKDNTVAKAIRRGFDFAAQQLTSEGDKALEGKGNGFEIEQPGPLIVLSGDTATANARGDGVAAKPHAAARINGGSFAGNGRAGIFIDPGAHVRISQISSTNNGGPGIDILGQPTGGAPTRGVSPNSQRKLANSSIGYPDPLVFYSQRKKIEGHTCPHCVVEGYVREKAPGKDDMIGEVPFGEGVTFAESVTANRKGDFEWPRQMRINSCGDARIYTFTASRIPRAGGKKTTKRSPASAPPVTSEFSPPAVCELPKPPPGCQRKPSAPMCVSNPSGTTTGGGGSGSPGSATQQHYTCAGPQTTLFDNSNGDGVKSGASPPTFSTGAHAYCLTSITTYHWNDEKGAAPGSLGLTVLSSALQAHGTRLGPWHAQSSSGQNGAPNVNWYVYPPREPPVVIEGSYSCYDSDPASWSWNEASGGLGFCAIQVIPAVVG